MNVLSLTKHNFDVKHWKTRPQRCRKRSVLRRPTRRFWSTLFSFFLVKGPQVWSKYALQFYGASRAPNPPNRSLNEWRRGVEIGVYFFCCFEWIERKFGSMSKSLSFMWTIYHRTRTYFLLVQWKVFSLILTLFRFKHVNLPIFRYKCVTDQKLQNNKKQGLLIWYE